MGSHSASAAGCMIARRTPYGTRRDGVFLIAAIAPFWPRSAGLRMWCAVAASGLAPRAKCDAAGWVSSSRCLKNRYL
jgi:hypothetical protein